MAENDTATFDTWDYVVLAVMLIISAGIGVYYRFTGGRQKTTQVSIVDHLNLTCPIVSSELPWLSDNVRVCVMSFWWL
jgi:sodium-coupled monocarboxylate transporter 8/12